MTQPKQARATKQGRTYQWGDETFWSVTTILGALAKPALKSWGERVVAEYAVERRAEWLPLADADPAAAIRAIKGAPYQQASDAADRGTAVHAAIESLTLGRPVPDKWPITVADRMEHFDRFVEEYQPEWLAAEATVYNRRRHYAGTLDGICRIGGATYVLDVKTSKGVYPDMALQLAAYRHAEFIGAPDGTEVPLPTTDGAVILHLRPDGYSLVEVRSDEEILRAFLHIAQAHRWMIETSKTAILADVPPPVRAA